MVHLHIENFHMKGFTLALTLKQSLKATWKYLLYSHGWQTWVEIVSCHFFVGVILIRCWESRVPHEIILLALIGCEQEPNIHAPHSYLHRHKSIHVIGVCLPSQIQSPKSTIKKAHKPAQVMNFSINVSVMIDSHTILLFWLYRINKPSACFGCVICISRSVHFNILTFYYINMGKGLYMLFLS